MVAGVHPTAQLEPIGTYAIVDLGTLGGTSSEASGVNLLGDVAGASMMVSGRQHAFLFRGGRLMDLGTLIGGISSYATAVADTGMVVGYSDIDLYGFGIPGGIEGFVWQNGAMKSLGALWCPCSSSRRYGTSRAFAVNNAGLIVGGSLAMTHGHGQFTQAFMFQTNRMDDVGSWEDGRASSSTAFGINDLGEIAGVIDGHPFVIHDGVRDEIALAPGVVRTEARAINRKRQIAGTSIATDGTARAFLRDFGVSRDLPPLLGDVFSEARAINVDGDVVGRSGTADFATSHAVLWRDGMAIDLNEQIDEEGWTLSVATGINDIGQVVGTGVHLGQQRAFLLKRASRRLQ